MRSTSPSDAPEPDPQGLAGALASLDFAPVFMPGLTDAMLEDARRRLTALWYLSQRPAEVVSRCQLLLFLDVIPTPAGPLLREFPPGWQERLDFACSGQSALPRCIGRVARHLLKSHARSPLSTMEDAAQRLLQLKPADCTRRELELLLSFVF
jgi:hypothetical protein